MREATEHDTHTRYLYTTGAEPRRDVAWCSCPSAAVAALLQLSLLMPHILPRLAKPALATEVLPVLARNSPSVWKKSPPHCDPLDPTISASR
ncbi:hypothetical protein AOLI_G00180880 [Acnodon oligacanthus]